VQLCVTLLATGGYAAAAEPVAEPSSGDRTLVGLAVALFAAARRAQSAPSRPTRRPSDSGEAQAAPAGAVATP
jgi:hypothetical protein